MPSVGQNFYPIERRPGFALGLLLSFLVIFGVACIVAHQSHTKAIDATIRSNETRATLLSKLIREHQRAAIGILQSYADRSLLVNSVKRRDFEGTLKHLIDLAKHNPEMDWPFLSNPDSTVWVNYPVDRQVMNKDLSYRDWYKGVKKQWKPYISSVYKLIVGEKDLAVAVSAPILDEKGKVIGILSTAQSTAFFRKIVGEVGLNLDSKITLIDQEGHIVYSNGFPYTKEVINYPDFEFVRRAMKGERGDVKVRDPSDRDRVKYVSFAPLEGIGWSILVEKTGREVLRSELSFLVLIGVISLLIYGVVVLFLIYSRERHRQIKGLEKFNAELDSRVRERTAEIEAGNKVLQETEERYRHLVQHSPAGIYEIDFTTGHFTQVNDAMCQILGYTQDELLAVTAFDILDDEGKARFASRIRLAQSGATPQDVAEYRVRTKDGRFLWSLLNVTFKWDGNKIIAASVVAHDITERKRAGDALRVSEEKYRTLFESMTQGVVYQDAEGKVISANPAAEAVLGVTLEQMKGRTSGDPQWRSIHEDGSDFSGDTHPTMTSLMTGTKTKNVIMGVYNPQLAEYRWLKIDAVPQFRPGEDKPYQVYSLFDDITEGRKVVEELKGSEEKFSALYSSMVEGVALHEVVYNSSGKPVDYIIKDVNPAYESATGLTRDKVIGKRASEVYGINEAPYLDIYEKVARSGGPASFDTYFDPMKKHFSISVFSPAKGEFATVFTDITERKRAEESLRESECRERERAAELAALLDATPAAVFIAHDPDCLHITGNSAADVLLRSPRGGEASLSAPVEVRPLHFKAVKDGRELRTDELPAQVAARGIQVQDFEFSLIFDDRTTRHVVGNGTPLRDEQGRPRGSILVLTDITERKRAEEALRRKDMELEADLGAMAMLKELGSLFLHEGNLPNILAEVVNAAIAISGADFGNIQILDPKSSDLKIVAHRGFPQWWVDFWNSVSKGRGACGTALERGERVIVEDVEQSPIFVDTPALEIQIRAGVRAVQSTPIVSRSGKPLGMFSTHYKTPRRPDDRVLRLLDLLARQASDIIERAQAEESLQQRTLELQNLNETLEQRVKERTAELANLSSQLVSAQENERRRVSYDLHDNAWQTLLAIRFDIENLFSGQDDWATLHGKSKKVTAVILDTVGKIRSMQGDLWPYVLDDIGILATMDWYCREFAKNHSGITIKRKGDVTEDEIPSSTKIVIYRILQETLNNVAKHSQASDATIRLMKKDHGVEFTVEDNGIGFNPEETISRRTPWGGLGLLNIKARTELSGGVFGVESAEGKGTTVRASWPI